MNKIDNFNYKSFVVTSYDENKFEKKLNDLLEFINDDRNATLMDIKYQFHLDGTVEVYSAIVIAMYIDSD